MDRKKTILIAVFINAGLLAVLFIAALTMQEDVREPMDVAQRIPPNVPLYSEIADSGSLAVGRSPKQEDFPSLPALQLPLPASPSKVAEEPVVHHLPPLAVETPAPAPAVIASSVADLREIKVKKGDSLEKIARISHTTVDEIVRLNRLPNHFLKIGQVLKLPKAQAVAGSKKSLNSVEKGSSAPDYYTVKVGDNPWTIAMKHHIKVEELLRINGLNEEKARKLKPGDRLRIR